MEQDWNEWRKRPAIDSHSGYLLGTSVFPLKTKNAMRKNRSSNVPGKSFVGRERERHKGRLVGRFNQRSGLRDVRVVRHLQARMSTVAQKSISEFGEF